MFFFKKKKAKKEALAKAAAEKLAAEKAEEARKAERLAAAKAASAAKAAAERAAKEQAEKEAAEKAAAEEAAAQKRSDAAKKAAATRATNKAEQQRIEQERLAAEQAERERLAAIKGYMIVKPTKDGRFVYVVVAGNKEVIAKGAQTYASAATCRSAVESVAKIAKSVPIEDQTLVKFEEQKFPKFELYMDKGGKYRFRLFASNGQQLLACTQGYTQKASCKNGIQSVISNCEGRIEISKELDD
jgi:uncharacterized protein YegP (UPF0339 family)